VFFVLVKFLDQATPVIFGTSHIGQASKLATMANVEWVSPTIANGAAIEHKTDNGGNYSESVTGPHIKGYTP
jgi:hypothetical protein